MTRTGMGAVVATLAAQAIACGGETCGDDCTQGLSCSEVLDASDDEELSEALDEAGAGTCIALAAGTYGNVSLPARVSLVGPGSGQAKVGTIAVPAGAGAVVRGLHVAGVVKLAPDAVDVRLERLLVTGSKNGVQADARASFTLADSTLRGVPDNAVLAVDAARVTIERTVIEDTTGPGLWAQCSAGCDCADPVDVSLTDVTFRNNAHTSAVLVGAAAVLRGVEIADTQPGPNFGKGGGLAAACSSLDAEGVTIENSSDYGMLLASVSGKVGNDVDEHGIIIINSRGGGMWIGGEGDGSLTIQNALLQNSGGVGMHLGMGSKGIIIINSKVESTSLETVPAEGWVADQQTKLPIGNEDVGDGMIWGFGASALVDGFVVSGSARNSILIDGAVGSGSALENVTLESGDDAKGIVQQHVMSMSEAPTVTASPMIQQLPDAPSGTPVAPLVPETL